MSRFSKGNSDPQGDTTPELGAVDMLLEASLDEWLGRSRPISNPLVLSQQISQRAEQSLFTEQELEQSVRNAARDMQAIARSRAEPGKRRSYSWSTFAAIAASIGAVSLIGWWATAPNPHGGTQPSARTDTRSSDPKLADSPPVAGSLNEPPGVSATERASLSQSTAGALVDDSHREDRKRADLKTGPEGLLRDAQPSVSMPQETLEARVAEEQQTKVRGYEFGSDVDRQITSVIDSQFHQAWKQLGLLEEPTNNAGLTAERIARLVLRRLPTTAELEAFRLEKLADKSVTDKSISGTLIKHWLAGDEFNRVWADRFVDFYTGGQSSESDQYLALRDWLEELIRQDLPLEEIQKKLLLGLGQAGHPANTLEDHWSRFAGQSDPTNRSWVGMNSADQRRLQGLTQLVLSLTGNAAITCTQCHTDQARKYPSWLADRLPAAADVPGAEPVDFESVAAMVMPWSRLGRSELFSREQDNRISKVLGRFPDGRRLSAETTTDQIVESWVGQGSRDQRGLVKWIWKDFFGEPLGSDFGLDSEIASQEREDLIEYLGKQIVEQKAGVRQIVYWLLTSEPARQPEETLSYAQYLAMDAEKLKDYSARRRVFKSLMIQPAISGTNKARAVQQYARTLFPERPDWLEQSLLAQPASQRGAPPPKLDPSANPRPMDQESTWGPDILKAELDYRTAGEQTQKWGRLLSESKLSDHQIIEHAYLISKHRFPTSEEHKAWDASSWSKSDRATAILRLLAAVKHSH